MTALSLKVQWEEEFSDTLKPVINVVILYRVKIMVQKFSNVNKIQSKNDWYIMVSHTFFFLPTLDYFCKNLVYTYLDLISLNWS